MYGFGDMDRVLDLRTGAGQVLAYDVDGRLCPIGLNSEGLAVGIFNLHFSHPDGFDKPSLPVQAVVWELLLGQYTLKSAIVFLRSLAVNPMCGSALLLGDATGSCCVELNSTGQFRIPEPAKDVPIVRANHPLDASFLPSYGDRESAHRDSVKRMLSLSLKVREAHQNCANLAGNHALELFISAPKVRNPCTLACISIDILKKELVIDFKERFPATDGDVEELLESTGKSRPFVKQLMKLGTVVAEEPLGDRITTGAEAEHIASWTRRTYALSHK